MFRPFNLTGREKNNFAFVYIVFRCHISDYTCYIIIDWNISHENFGLGKKTVFMVKLERIISYC